ncbi:MAG: MFS transporter [Chloroflexi bacterium]|nr:MFS transporter [Chloroflexota bacterium]
MGKTKENNKETSEIKSGESTIPESEVRRSFTLGIFNGAIFNLAEALIDPPLVLTWFVSQITSSNLLAGLVSPLGNAGWFLPQIFVSARIQRMERKMPSYTLTAVIRIIVWILLAVMVWTVDDPQVLLVSFFVLYSIARLTSGLAGLTFFDVVAKTIPARRRGSFFSWRQLLGGMLGLGGGWIVKTVLNHPSLPFPNGHALLFSLYCVAIVPGLLSFIMIREPPRAVTNVPVTIKDQLQRARQLLRENRVYRRHLSARTCLILAGVVLPFYGIYAKDRLGAPEGMVGVYVTTRIAAQMLFNLPWGRLSDRYGNRLAMRLLSLGSGATTLLALILIALVEFLQLQGTWLPYLALPLFFLNGAIRPAQVLSGSNFLLELVPEDERPLYMGLSNTLMGIIVLISGVGGLVVDFVGFAGLFAISLMFYLLGYVFASGLPEPREATQ